MLDDSEKIIRLREYYSTKFTTGGLRKVIGLQNFSCREFAFQAHHGGFIRNLSFERPKELTNYLKENAPLSAYVGAVYSSPPSTDQPIQNIEWDYRELVFDIDINDYDNVRTCGCRGKNQICHECWKLLNPVILMLDETFERDFGYTIQWAFSGNRGLHAWVKGDDTDVLSRQQRRAVVDYLTMIRKGRLSHLRAGDRRKLPIYFLNRIMRLILTTAFNLASEAEFLNAGFKQPKITEILKLRESHDTLTFPQIQNLTKRILNMEEINRAFLERWYPRFDENVTTDIRRVLRIPGSIHGTTGKACRLLENYEIIPKLIFDPFEELSIYD